MSGVFVWLALCAAVAVVGLVWRRVFPKPFPPWLAPILDTRLRRRALSPELAAERHGISDGMRVLEIGPGNGYLTAIARRRAGRTGMLICLDIQLPMLQKLRGSLGEETPPLVCASGSRLPLRNGSVDLAFLCDVLGEIPDKPGAFHELHRVLKPGGTLAITEALPDPDYVRASVVTGLARGSGVLPAKRFGSRFQYTQRFTRAQ